MTENEAIEYAKTMTFRDAIYNALQGRAVPFRKATKIKLNELLEIADKANSKITTNVILDEIRAEIAEYKDDKIIHAERNEMIVIVLEIIDKYRAESEDKE